MTELEWLGAAIRGRVERGLDAKDLRDYRDALTADGKVDELVEREVDTHTDWTLPEP